MKTETEIAGPDAITETPVQLPCSRPQWRQLRGPAAGALLFALYLVLLTRRDLDAVPGGWITLAGLIIGALMALAAPVVLGRRRATAVSGWVAAHAALVTVSAITAGAFALRVFGISDNLPYINYPDEPAVADRAIGILQTGDYNLHYFVYPSLYIYMQAALYLARFFMLVSNGTVANIGSAIPTDFYLLGRLLTALLGTLTIPLVYWAGRRLYNTEVGLVAAAFMATNSVHLVFSQLITTDVPAAFFAALALVATVRIMPRKWAYENHGGRNGHARMPSVWRYLLAGVAIGLAIGPKYNSALVVLPFLLAHAYAVAATSSTWLERLRQLVGGRLWIGLGAVAVTFQATTPYALFDLPNFLNDVASVVAHDRFGHTGHEGNDNWLFFAGAFLSSDFLPTLLTLLGVGVAFIRHRREDVLLVAFPIAFYFAANSYRVNFERNLLPILPFTSIRAALPLVLLWKSAVAWLQSSKSGSPQRGRNAIPAQGTAPIRPPGGKLRKWWWTKQPSTFLPILRQAAICLVSDFISNRMGTRCRHSSLRVAPPEAARITS